MPDDAPDVKWLGLALRTYCERIEPTWRSVQFDSTVSQVLDRCLALLELVTTPDEAQKWLAVSKVVMARALGGEFQ